MAPAYSTSSPLGPISPEVVDALSRVSIECRQSFVASILSSTSLQQQLASGGGGGGGGVGNNNSSSRISMASSFAENNESPHLHHQQLHSFAAVTGISATNSPRTSSVSSQYGEGVGGNHNQSNDPSGSSGSEAGTGQETEEGEVGEGGGGEGSAASLATLSSSALPSNSPSATALLQHLHQHLQQEPPPPSYDPTWRTALVIPNHDPSYSRRLHWLRNQNSPRTGSGGGGERPLAGYRHSSESYSRDGYLSPPYSHSNSHRRTGSISAPIVRPRVLDAPTLLQRASTQLRTRALSNNMDRTHADYRHHQQQQQQQSQPHPPMPPLQRIGSRRSISWTGSPIRFTLNSSATSTVGTAPGQEAHARTNSTRSTFRSLIQRSPLSSSVTTHHTTTVAAAASSETWTANLEETMGTAPSSPRLYHQQLNPNASQQPPVAPPPPLQPIRSVHPRSPGTEHSSRFVSNSMAETRVEMVEPLSDSPLSD